jgi:hypothetical protein
VITVVPHNLAADGLKVYLENRVHAKMAHQKVDIYRDLVARGMKGSSWRGDDASSTITPYPTITAPLSLLLYPRTLC